MKKFVNTVALLLIVATAAGCGLSSDPQRMIAKAQEYREKKDNKAAIIELKNVLQKDSSHAEARYWLGVTYYDAGDFRSAEPELRRALELRYDRNKVMPALGKSMLLLGDFQKILDQMQVEEGASNKVQAEILTIRARASVGLGRIGPARELLDQALAKQPEFPSALIEQARLAAGDQKLDESARLIARAIASEPKSIDAWLMKGELARVSADQAGVLAANQKVLEVDPRNIPARLNIASLHIANKRFDEARKLISQVNEITPGNPMAGHMRALVNYQVRDYKAAQDDIQRVLKVAPNYMPSVLLAGNIFMALGSYEQAQAHFVRVLDSAPGNLYARKLMISSLARNGQLQRAIEILQPGLKQAPEDNGLLTIAGELYIQSGEFAKAAEYLDLATKRDPKNAMARTKLGVSRMALGDTDRALADLESAAELDTDRHQADIVLIASYLKLGKYDQALKAMEALEKKQPNEPSNYNLKAAIYLGKKDIPNARKNLERALELRPTYLAAATNLAQLDIQDKNPKSARRRLESILEKDKNNVQVLLTLANLGEAVGATQKEQIDWLEQAGKTEPRSVQPQLMLARLYVVMGDTKKALEVALRAQGTSPEDPQVLDLLGATQIKAGQAVQAIITYGKLARLQPNSPVVLYRLASAQAGNADHAAAGETLKKALSLKPDYLDAQISLMSTEVRAKRYQEAVDVARQIQKQHPKSAVGFALEGDVLMEEKKYSQAIKMYETAHGMAKNAASMIKLHMAYALAGKTGEGDTRLVQWLKASPEDATVRLYVADIALKRGNYNDAIPQYEWLLKKQPDNVIFLNNLAWAYYEMKDTRALETAERALKLAPENAEVVDTVGWILIERGNTKRGLELLEKAAKAAPKSPQIAYHLAQGWAKVGDKSKARRELERLLATDVKFPQLAEAQKLFKELSK